MPYNTSAIPAGLAPAPLGLLATTGPAGVALINGTPVILTWNVPNDGLLHRFLIAGCQVVTNAETGGAVVVNSTAPDGTVIAPTLFAAGAGLGYQYTYTSYGAYVTVKAGTTVTVQQSTALTAGAAKVWAEIWGS